MRPKTYICRPRGCGPCIREYTEPPEECCFKGCRVPGFCPHPEWYELVQVEMTRKGNVKDELYVKAVARLKRSNDDLEQIVRAILLNPTLRAAAREEYCDLERWEEEMVASAACRRAVTDIEAILEWPED
jgi:hypothetical protein